MIGGVSPTLATQADCPLYKNFLMLGTSRDGQPIGQGCIYPARVPTVANQLEASGRSWTGYMEDMGNDPTREPATCGHVPVGTPDGTTNATATDQYAQRHDPFVYFHSVLDSPSCAANVVPAVAARLGPLLGRRQRETCRSSRRISAMTVTTVRARTASPVASRRRTPSSERGSREFSRRRPIRPTGCSSSPSTRRRRRTRRPAVASVPGRTLRGRASPVQAVDASAPCCSRRSITPASVSDTPYNHYGLLRTIEDAFALSHLGSANGSGVSSFESKLSNLLHV